MDNSGTVPSENTCNVHTIVTLDTIQTADSVEFCPIEGNQDLLVCGTYQLDEQAERESCAQSRTGHILCVRLNWSTEEGVQAERGLSFPTPGVLDMKWNSAVLGAAVASGAVEIYAMPGRELEKRDDIAVIEGGLALSLDWSENNRSRCAVSGSGGEVALLDTEARQVVSSWKAHDYEAWITAFDCSNDNVVLSGGDDCKLKIWDIRREEACLDLRTCKSSHSAGVCSIQCCRQRPHYFLSGSYDESILLWDLRQTRSYLSQVFTGGGVWRVKWSPGSANRIAAACMHNGFHILEHQDFSELTLSECYSGHSSLSYGVDWCHVAGSQLPMRDFLASADQETENSTRRNCLERTDQVGESKVMASCSFYDHSLHFWSLIV